MAEKIESFLEIKVDYADAMKKLGEYRTALEAIKQGERNLAQERNAGKISAQEYNEEVSALKIEQQQYTEAIRVLNKEVKNEIKTRQDDGTSLKSMRAQLSNLVKDYDSLSKAERESAKGKALQQHIADLTNEIKANEFATARYWRNVGNYPAQLADQFLEAYMATGKLSAGFKTAGSSVAAFGKQLLGLLANPVVAIFAAIALAVMAIVDAFKRSESQTNRLKQIFAAFQPVLDAVLNIFSAMADVVLAGVEGMMKLASAIGLTSRKTKEYIALERERQALVEENRKLTVFEAAVENKVAKLRDKVAQKDKYTTEQRRDMLQRAINEEKALAKYRQNLAKRELAVLEAEAAKTENNAEMNDALAAAKEKVYRTDTEYYNTTRRLQTQLASFNEELAKGTDVTSANTAAVNDNAQALQERADKERDAIRQAEDAMLALMEEGAEKQRAELRLQYQREIEDLEAKLETEKNLTARAREAINVTITAKQQQLAQELNKISKEQLDKEVQLRAQQISELVSLAEKGTAAEYSARRTQAQQKYDLAVEEANKEITNAQLLATQLALIEQQYNATIDQIEKDEAAASYQRAVDGIKARYEAEIAAAYDNELTKAQLRERQTQEELAQAQERGRLIGETQEEFNSRMLGLEQARLEASRDVAEKEAEVQKAKFEVISSAIGGLSGMFEKLGEDNKAFAKLSKVLALGEVAVNMGKAIAAGIAQSQSVPFPANLAAMASTIASVTAGIASAISTIKSAKFAHGGLAEERKRYATGGTVTGAGSGTSDSIPAMLSNGESVLTAVATSMFAPVLSSLNQLGGGVPINVAGTGSQAMGEEMLARAVARGVAALPNPVVSVQEINQTNQRVEVLENLATL